MLLADIRFGFRSLQRSPGLAILAVLSLALGIGSSTAVYSVIYGVVLHPFIYKDVDNLMSVRVTEPGQRGGRVYYSTDQFLDIAGRNTIFEGTIASTISDVLWTGDGEPQRLRGNYGTPETFQVMGVPALHGRYYLPSDAATDAEPVCVLGYRFWQRQFGGDPRVIGRRLRLNEKVRTIVGVMPPRFMWRGADVYLPIVLERGRAIEGVRLVHLLGRRKPGVTEAQAEADLRPIIEELKRREPTQFPEKWRVGLLSFRETFPSGLRDTLWILFAAVGLLLLIACANVSNLLLSRAAGRQKEMAVRAALGAGRIRLVRQLLTESLVLAITGGAAGVLFAYGGAKAILAMMPPGIIPDESEVAVNTPVLLFALGVSALTSIIFGLAPALHVSTPQLANPLKETGRAVTAGLRQKLLRGGLVVSEVGLSMILLVGAGLMIRTLMAMQDVPLGIRAGNVLTMRVPLTPQRYPEVAQRNAFIRELVERVAVTPGVAAAGVNTFVHPFGNFTTPIEVVGSTTPDDRPVTVHQINPGYLNVMGIGLVQGRVFTESEATTGQRLAVVNEMFVRRYLDGRPALGQIVRAPLLKRPPFRMADDSFQITGVVRDTLNRSLTNEIAPEIYVPYTLTGMSQTLVVLTRTSPMALANDIRRQVYAVQPDQPVTDVRTIEIMLRDFVFGGPKFNLVLFSVFAGLGLALAVIGVYGVISHSVSQQTQEIGVRIALGAGFGDIARMVLLRGLRLLLIGIAVGIAGGALAVRLIERQIWSVSRYDAVTFGA
ncbi:MAG: ABC transporter permease, partial [Bryobacteraceae bacterium]